MLGASDTAFHKVVIINYGLHSYGWDTNILFNDHIRAHGEQLHKVSLVFLVYPILSLEWL